MKRNGSCMQAQSVATATRSVLAQVRSLPAEERPLLQALGTVLAAPVVAAQACPPFAASIKDGYAVRSVDGAGEYELTGASRAGQGAKAAPLSPRQAAYVTTGAPLPACRLEHSVDQHASAPLLSCSSNGHAATAAGVGNGGGTKKASV